MILRFQIAACAIGHGILNNRIYKPKYRMSVRIERRGEVKPLTPRFMRFMREALGGLSLDDLQAPNQMRADFACLRGLLAVEVKSLEEDASARLSNLTEELEEREDWPLFYGAWPFDSVIANLKDPDPVKRRVAERIGRAIVNHLKKANDQLAAHATAFPRANLVRLVVLINEDHEVYDPAMAVYVIQRVLTRLDGERLKYESIDAVMFLSERHATRIGDDVAFPIVTVTGRPVEEAIWKGEVLDFMASKWSGWTGARHISIETESAASVINSFTTIEHIPDQMRRQDKWHLEYRRNPYMRSWSYEQIRDHWDEVNIVGMLAFIKDAPVKPSKDEIARFLERFTHLMDEIAHRGLPMTMFKAEPNRMNEAARRTEIPQAGLAWLAAYFEGKADD